MLFVQLAARGHSVRIVFQRVGLGSCLLGDFRKLCVVVVAVVMTKVARIRIDGNIALSNCSRTAKYQSCNKRRHAHEANKNESDIFHWRPPNSRPTSSPKPENSRDRPQRISKRWLLSFNPNPGDTRKVQPEGRFQAATGAR